MNPKLKAANDRMAIRRDQILAAKAAKRKAQAEARKASKGRNEQVNETSIIRVKDVNAYLHDTCQVDEEGRPF